ncbi:VOC family protein [Egicoccus sp. AB-alg6-2]|uniref:VOC family protein n=1 Tax=Egicoccus sp. AB-alg6-2 TaxID=3242692 RepID=UPI00359EAAB8
MPIATVPDHVAVAVPDIEAAAERWHDQLGGGWVGPRFPVAHAGFATRQLRYAGGAKLELLEPTTPDGFAAHFLARFGARIHHVTLKVAALLPAVERLRAEGLDVVDVFAEGDVWHEGFLRPSQVGGLIVQVAWSGRSDTEWAQLAGLEPEPPAQGAARLLGPTLMHPSPTTAADVWRRLGAEVDGDDDGVRVRWPDAPLDVEIVPGATAGPVGLRFQSVPMSADAAGDHPPGEDAVAGPPVLVPAGRG